MFRTILLCAGLFTAACGGGGAAPAGGPVLQGAALEGLVYEVDGQTADRSGVVVTVLETGASAVTGPEGRFFFRDLPAGGAALAFGLPLPRLASDDDDGFDDDDDFDEDDDGNPRVNCVTDGDTVEVRAAVSHNGVTEFSSSCPERLRAEARLVPAAGSPLSGLDGEVKVARRADREKFEVEAEHLAPGTVVEFFLDDPADAAGFVSIGTAVADAGGEAELERNTNDGEALPLGAATAADLGGFGVEVRLPTGELLLTGTVPELPDGVPAAGDDGAPLPGGRSRSKARLTPLVSGLEGEVELRSRPEKGEMRFKMEAENLPAGARVAFEIEDPDNAGSFLRFATAFAGGDGEAEVNTQDGLPLPLGVTDVAQLVGLRVRVVQDDGSGLVLLEGVISPLVAD